VEGPSDEPRVVIHQRVKTTSTPGSMDSSTRIHLSRGAFNVAPVFCARSTIVALMLELRPKQSIFDYDGIVIINPESDNSNAKSAQSKLQVAFTQAFEGFPQSTATRSTLDFSIHRS